MNNIDGIINLKCIDNFGGKENHPSFLADDYYFKLNNIIDEESIAFHKSNLIEIKCLNPDCMMLITLNGEEAIRVLKHIKTDGCPICGQKNFELSTT